jgi:hypothetical protein
MKYYIIGILPLETLSSYLFTIARACARQFVLQRRPPIGEIQMHQAAPLFVERTDRHTRSMSGAAPSPERPHAPKATLGVAS